IDSPAGNVLKLTYRVPITLLRIVYAAIKFVLETATILAFSVSIVPLVLLGFTIAAAVRSDNVDYERWRGHPNNTDNFVKAVAATAGLSFTANYVINQKFNPLIPLSVGIINAIRVAAYFALLGPRLIGRVIGVTSDKDLSVATTNVLAHGAVLVNAMVDTIIWPFLAVYEAGKWAVSGKKTQADATADETGAEHRNTAAEQPEIATSFARTVEENRYEQRMLEAGNTIKEGVTPHDDTTPRATGIRY
ncbi:MAG: hypothetical protein V4490_04220, partial [Pseudomonadota bacterium]